MIQKYVNVPITFTPSDLNVINNIWKVNGIIESNELIFNKTFTSPGIYIVTHECTANCGTACTPYTEQIELLVLPSSPEDYMWIFLLFAIGVGVVYFNSQPQQKVK